VDPKQLAKVVAPVVAYFLLCKYIETTKADNIARAIPWCSMVNYTSVKLSFPYT
jgi:hypothetical protein